MIGNFKAWYAQSFRGKSYVYHVGYLARDRETKPRDDTEKAYYAEIANVANYAYKLQEAGKVSLVQRRLEPMKFEYIAVKIR